MSKTTVTIADNDIEFDVSVDDFNQYLNEQMPNDKVAPAFNFLSRTVVEKDKETLKKLVLTGGKPNGMIVMQVAGVLAAEVGGGVNISLKKPKPSPEK